MQAQEPLDPCCIFEPLYVSVRDVPQCSSKSFYVCTSLQHPLLRNQRSNKHKSSSLYICSLHLAGPLTSLFLSQLYMQEVLLRSLNLSLQFGKIAPPAEFYRIDTHLDKINLLDSIHVCMCMCIFSIGSQYGRVGEPYARIKKGIHILCMKIIEVNG